jgi:hypothetical protein
MRQGSNRGSVFLGRALSVLGLVLAALGLLDESVALDVLGIVLGMLGYALGSRVLGGVVSFLSLAVIFISYYVGKIVFPQW